VARYLNFNDIARGNVPEKHHFQQAATEIRLKLAEMLSGDLISFGVIYGSVARGDSSRRSDVDLFVIASKGRRVEAIVEIGKVAGDILDKYNIEIDPYVPCREICVSRVNAISPGYWNHICLFKGDFIGEFPGYLIIVDTVEEDVRRWITRKIMSIQKYIGNPRYLLEPVENNSDFLEALGKANDVFSYGARKIGSLIQENMGLADDYSVQSKDLFKEFSEDLYKMIDTAHQLSREYSDYLDELLAKNMLSKEDRGDYRNYLLNRYVVLLPLAMDFLIKTAQHLWPTPIHDG